MPEPEPKREGSPRLRRALLWLLKAPFRLAWWLLKMLGRALWAAFRAGFKAGRDSRAAQAKAPAEPPKKPA
jgi:hypothetical protein